MQSNSSTTNYFSPSQSAGSQIQTPINIGDCSLSYKNIRLQEDNNCGDEEKKKPEEEGEEKSILEMLLYVWRLKKGQIMNTLNTVVVVVFILYLIKKYVNKVTLSESLSMLKKLFGS